jgi:hypothetical protein
MRIEVGVIWFDSSVRGEDARGRGWSWNCFASCNCTKEQPAAGAGTNREKRFNTEVTENTENAEETKKKRRNSALRP